VSITRGRVAAIAAATMFIYMELFAVGVAEVDRLGFMIGAIPFAIGASVAAFMIAYLLTFIYTWRHHAHVERTSV
jgi:uncharacterized membrane protein (DUF485 family)